MQCNLGQAVEGNGEQGITGAAGWTRLFPSTRILCCVRRPLLCIWLPWLGCAVDRRCTEVSGGSACMSVTPGGWGGEGSGQGDLVLQWGEFVGIAGCKSVSSKALPALLPAWTLGFITRAAALMSQNLCWGWFWAYIWIEAPCFWGDRTLLL